MQTTRHLLIQRFESLDDFEGRKIFGHLRWRSFNDKPFSLSRAITALPGNLIVFERSTVRRLEGTLNAGACSVILPMESSGQSVVNSRQWGASHIGLLRGAIPFDMTEEIGNPHAIIRMNSTMQDRGWPEGKDDLALSRNDTGSLNGLRNILKSILAIASDVAQTQDFTRIAASLEADLVAALDRAFVMPGVTRVTPGSFDRNRALVSKLEEILRQDASRPLYNDELASAVGASVRSIHTAVHAIHGVSPHQFLRQKRLWMLRSQLVKGIPGLTVQIAAQAHGFWHMSDLSKSYKERFGESPSDTLARAKRLS